jgi:hypothetical protein
MGELLESDECLRCCEAEEGTGAALKRLGRHGECVLVSIGQNRAARQGRLDAEGLSDYFVEMQGLSADPLHRPAQLGALAGASRRTLVAASTTALVQAAGQARLLVVGLSAGAANPRRLRQAGAQEVFANLGEVADELDAGALRLQAGGLLP